MKHKRYFSQIKAGNGKGFFQLFHFPPHQLNSYKFYNRFAPSSLYFLPLCHCLPLHHCCPPGKPGAEAAEHDFIPAGKASLPVDLIQQDRHAGRGDISTMIQAYRELIHRNMKSFRYGLDNPQVRLVQEKYLISSACSPACSRALCMDTGTVVTANL